MSNSVVLPDGDVVETLIENGLVIVDVADGNADGSGSSERRASSIGSQDGDLRDGVRFTVDVLAGGNQTGAGVDLEPVRMGVGRIDDRVADEGIVAVVAIQRRQLEDGRARIGHFEHVGVVHALIELRGVVVGVGHPEVELARGVQRRTALVGGGDDQRVVGTRFAVQRQLDDHEIDDVVPGGEAEVAVAAVQRHVDVGVLFLRVGIVDGDARHELAGLGVLRDLGRGVVRQEDEIDGGLVVVDVGDANGHEGRRLQGLDAVVAGHHHQFVHLLGLEVERAVDRDDAGAGVDGEHRVAVALPPIDRVADAPVVGLVRVGGEHLQDAGPDGGVLGHAGKVAALVEDGLVVVHVLDGDVDRHGAPQRRTASVQRLDHQTVEGRRFAIQEPVDLQVQVEDAVALPVRRQPERVVRVPRHDVVPLRVEHIQIEILGRRQGPLHVPRRVLRELDLQPVGREGRRVVVLVLDAHHHADVLAAQRDRHQRVGRAQFPVQHHFAADDARRLFDVQVRVDGAARHRHDQVGRRRRTRLPRLIALADQPDHAAHGRTFRDFELANVLAARATPGHRHHHRRHQHRQHPRRR